jgi:hypothetical protein
VAGLKHTVAAIPAGGTRRVYGTAYWDGERWWANIGGNLVGAQWADPIQPAQGGKIAVDITDEGRGQSSAFVVSMYTDQPRPSTGTVTNVIPGGVATLIAFTGEDGRSYTTDRFIGSYDLGDPVYVTWDAAKPTVLGKVQTIAPPTEQELPPPPTAITTGHEVLTATASDTYGVGGWGRWATSTNGGEDVYTGSWGGHTVTGAWFYGTPRPVLQGKTITRIQFRLPARLRVGAYAAATIHLYAHNNGARPGGDVNRVAGPHDVVVQNASGPTWHDLPLSFAAALQAGGGISIAGDPYAGFNSRLKDPESGKLVIDWKA